MGASCQMFIDIPCNNPIPVFATAAIFGTIAVDTTPANNYVGSAASCPMHIRAADGYAAEAKRDM